jgi:hypothetical protein
MNRSETLKAAHVAAGYVTLRDIEAETNTAVIGILLAVFAELVLVASFEFSAGLVLIALLVAWILLCLLPPLRRRGGRSSIQVACSPEAAFALVSDPQSWRLWTPELDLVESSEAPVRLGTIVRSRLQIEGRRLDANERVAIFEPPWRCGSEILDICISVGVASRPRDSRWSVSQLQVHGALEEKDAAHQAAARGGIWRLGIIAVCPRP